ncbi:MAG TPA: succinylglutamate desuccinylase/aspartoacylase family protein [Candidatus Polarisedimenticolaceae bacterium]|nr:succinylglutamate desuccinylase/aspartoacylase family protein [Candidatus Polarisedimenticolaceae bacterium]
MTAARRKRLPLVVGGRDVRPGTTVEFQLKISEYYTASPVNVPVTVIRGEEDGPVVFLTAAIHGDELNGIEIVRRTMLGIGHDRIRGALVCVPVVNRFGFLNRSRYLPDRRDLNRSFPGSDRGPLASRVAATIFGSIVEPASAGLDFHTAAIGRVNLPHLRVDMRDATARRFARWFGAEIIVDGPGRRKSLRAAATSSGRACVVYEAGETAKFQPRAIRKGLAGVYNVLAGLGMLDIPRRPPRFQIVVRRADWVRAERGGIVDLRVKPGDLVYRGDTVGVISNPFGREVVSVTSHTTGVVLGTSTLPMVNPGDAVVHVARLTRTLATVERHAHVGSSGRARIRIDV